MKAISRVVCVGALALCATAGLAQQVDVIYSRALGTTSVVPGAVDTSGNPAMANFNSMLEFWLSPDGSRFLLRGATNQPSLESDSYLLLGGPGVTPSVVLQEGRPFPGAVGSELVDFLSGSVSYPFNANNDWVFALRAKGGVSTVAQKIVRVDASGGACCGSRWATCTRG